MGGVSSAGRPSRSRSSDQRAASQQSTSSTSAAFNPTGAQPASGGTVSTGTSGESGPSGSNGTRSDEVDRRRRQEMEDAALARRLMLEELGLGAPSARGGLSAAMATAVGPGSRLGLRHAACPSCQAQNEFRSTSTSTITLRCGMCANEFQVAGAGSQPSTGNASTAYAMQICRRCGTMNQFPAPPPGRPLPDVRCGQCGVVAPASQRAQRRLRGGDRELMNMGGPLVRINVNGERRVVSLLALLSLMAEENDRSNPAQGADIAALPTRKLAAAQGTDMQLGEQTKCLICLEQFADGDDVKTLPCLHFYHQRCVDQWLRTDNSCPVCKTPIGQVPPG